MASVAQGAGAIDDAAAFDGGPKRHGIRLRLAALAELINLPRMKSNPRQRGKKLRPNVEERLREELRATKESLQAIIEEQEATNEELKSANEEIESSNEELQSSNEELETAKEELQSTNEELQTLNEELGNRNGEMALVNNDLNNLLSSINLAIVMVDNALTVRRATPLAGKIFNLIPTDIGRRLSDLKPNLRITDLDARIRLVIDTLQTQECEVEDKQGRMYSLRIRPYRTKDNKIDGAVITLVDIDAIRRSNSAVEAATKYLVATIDLLPQPALLLNAEARVLHANRHFLQKFKFRTRDLVRKRAFDLQSTAWNAPALRRLLKRLQEEKQIKDFPIKMTLAPGKKLIHCSGQRLEHEADAFTVLTFAADEPGLRAPGRTR